MAGRTVVVGAGLAGLSAAIHLAAAGREVVVVEAAAVPGGRCGTVAVGGYRFDTGPSVLTMPEVVRSTVGAAGEELEDWLELRPLDPIYRIGFHDGSRLDVLPGAERMAAEVERLAGPEEAGRYLAFRDHLGRMLEAEWGPFIDRNYDGPADLARPLALLRLARLGGFRRLHHLVATHLTDWRLRRAHTFQALYTGLSPFDALGIYAVVAHMDTVGGAWFPASGGMHALAQALAGVAEKAGAGFRWSTRVERVEGGPGGVTGVVLAGGERLAADDERREERPGEERARRDRAMEQEARGPEPENHRAGDPGRKQRKPPVRPEPRRRDGHERDDSSEREEPDREPHLVGRRAHVDAPGPRVHVLIELADGESPEQEPDHDRDRRCREIVRSGAEEIVDEARGRPVEVHVRDQAVRECVLVSLGQVEDRDDDERSREH